MASQSSARAPSATIPAVLRRYIALFLYVGVLAPGLPTGLKAAEKYAAGGACSSDTNALDWDTFWECSSNVWARAPIILGTGTCASASDAGRLQSTGTAIQGCNGTSWGTIIASDVLGGSVTTNNPRITGSALSGFNSTAAATIGMATSSTNRVIITATGLGIGGGTPTSVLDVKGGVSIGAYAGSIAAPSNVLIVSGVVGIGTSSVTANSVLDVGAVGSMRLPKGTTAQRPATGVPGMFRYNSSLSKFEYYNNTGWTQGFTQNVSNFIPIMATARSGYFVLTQTTYTGNLGGIPGADASCLTELTTNTGWLGYSTANSNGQLVAGKVHAFLCDSSSCNMPLPVTTYAFANANDSTAGGATIQTNETGVGPNDSFAWSSKNAFRTSQYFWTGRNSSSATAYNTTANASTCLDWTSNSIAKPGMLGYTASTSALRWLSKTDTCANLYPLVCMVDP